MYGLVKKFRPFLAIFMWEILFSAALKILIQSCRLNKSRRMRWAGHVALMGEKRNEYGIPAETQ
jgi:hypothetical protein